MPSIVALKGLNNLKDIYLLIKEEDFPIEGIQQIQKKVKSFISEHESYTRDEIIAIAEDTIEDFYGTLVPFKLYLVSC